MTVNRSSSLSTFPNRLLKLFVLFVVLLILIPPTVSQRYFSLRTLNIFTTKNLLVFIERRSNFNDWLCGRSSRKSFDFSFSTKRKTVAKERKYSLSLLSSLRSSAFFLYEIRGENDFRYWSQINTEIWIPSKIESDRSFSLERIADRLNRPITKIAGETPRTLTNCFRIIFWQLKWTVTVQTTTRTNIRAATEIFRDDERTTSNFNVNFMTSMSFYIDRTVVSKKICR